MANADTESPKPLQISEKIDIEKLATADGDNPIFVTALKTLRSFNENPGQVAQDLTKLVNGVIEALELVSQLHPIVQVAAKAFTIIAKLELDRRSNNARIEGLIVAQADMVCVLFELRYIKRAQAPSYGAMVYPRLAIALQGAADRIMSCGLIIDTYKQKHRIVRFALASSWKEKFAEATQNFIDSKREIIEALQINMAVQLDHLRDTFDNVVLPAIQQQTAKETRMVEDLEKLKKKKEKMSRDVGRMKEERDKLATEVESLNKLIKFDTLNKSVMWEIPDDLFAQLVPIVGAREQRRGSVESIGDAKKRRGLETAAVLNAVFHDVNDLVEENRARFDYKMQEQTKRLESAISNSANLILAKLGDGPYKKVRDLDIRHIWQDNSWRTFIKTKTFIAALGDYFIDRFELQQRSMTSSMMIGSAVPQDSPLSYRGYGPEPNESPFEELEADKWCLQYLTPAYFSAVSEAFDNDFSGFVTISEANNFMSRGAPHGWSILKRIAYWVKGFHVSNSIYQRLIEDIWEKILCVKALPANAPEMEIYLDSDGLTILRCIVRDNYPTFPHDGELFQLVGEHMRYDEERLEMVLERIHYNIDAVRDYFGKRRIETYIFPLTYLVLKRHYQVIQLCATEVLDERSLVNAADTLTHIAQAALDRVSQLRAVFKHQKLDAKDTFTTFANGIYRRLSPNTRIIAPKDSYADAFRGLDPKLYTDPLQSHHGDIGPLDPSKLEYPLPCTAAMIVTLTAAEEARTATYLKLIRRKYIWENLRNKNMDPFTPEDALALQEIEREIEGLPSMLQDRCSALKELEPRKIGVHWGFHCDSCNMEPIVGIRWNCITCSNFDFCEECEAKRPPPKLRKRFYHKNTHNMVALPHYTSTISRERIVQDARKHTQLFLDYSDDKKLGENSDGDELSEEGSADEYQESSEDSERSEVSPHPCVGPCGIEDVSTSAVWYECFQLPGSRCDDFWIAHCEDYYCDECRQHQSHVHDQKAHRVLKVAQCKNSKPDDLEPGTDGNKEGAEDRLLKIELEIGKLGARFSRVEAFLARLPKDIVPK
ncbi:hypothetical protein BOTBODRAFT_181415 [Botryobasidium botryosum FD-172 SS1]|uniref:ZZ-type domain-containing protein n=1 Tax=Botryobasidium botryosum (strain FD-172 SS1) TaxID=930990 RepID=A0A067LTN0_BOTB1|nr:hypothetical protein BOTBODRAFT_181415 [Botryobasidium botryosum FD-172 SS1]